VNDVVERFIDINHRNPKHSISSVLEPLGFPLISVGFVEWTVHLYRKARQYADEVDEVRSYRDLAPEFVAADLPVSQPRPHAPLGLGHVVSKVSGTVGCRRTHRITILKGDLSGNPAR